MFRALPGRGLGNSAVCARILSPPLNIRLWRGDWRCAVLMFTHSARSAIYWYRVLTITVPLTTSNTHAIGMSAPG